MTSVIYNLIKFLETKYYDVKQYTVFSVSWGNCKQGKKYFKKSNT